MDRRAFGQNDFQVQWQEGRSCERQEYGLEHQQDLCKVYLRKDNCIHRKSAPRNC